MASAGPIDKVICKICQRQFSKYFCPSCNVPYCSLQCFRSESHAQCSENFYRKQVESDIQSEPSKTAHEKLKMIELLKRFEEESAQDDPESLDYDGGSPEETELAKRLKHIDLESTSPDDLWSMLTPKEQTKFLKALDNPSSDLVQQLLASEELVRERQEPWWEAPALDGDLKANSNSTTRYGVKPELILPPTTMIKPVPNRPSLVYNLCAICLAYSYTTRYFSVSPLSSLAPDCPDYQETRRVLSRLVPFLTNHRATTLYPNLSSVITDIWSRFDSGNMTSTFFSVLLRDTATLLRPSPVITLSSVPPESTSVFSDQSDHLVHPHRTSILVLSDLSKLFCAQPDGSQKSGNRLSHVAHKLLFYTAHILSMQSVVLKVVCEEILARLLLETEDPLVVSGPERITARHQQKVGFTEEI